MTFDELLAKLQALRIAKLEHEVARLRRLQFGRSSEQHAADQLRLLFEDAQGVTTTSGAVTGEPADDDTPSEDAAPAPIRRGGRTPLPAHLPRRKIEHLAGAGGNRCARPGCGGTQVRIGEDVAEVLDYIPARFEVIRPRLACRACERIVQTPVP